MSNRAKFSQAEFEAAVSVAKDTDWARLAAYIDGEGSVFIQRSSVKTGRKRPNYVLTLIVAGTDYRLMRWLVGTFTGNVYFSQSKNMRIKSKKTCHSWRIFDDRAGAVLERCSPYMIIKKEQAEVALAYRALRRLGSKGRKLTDEDISMRDEFYTTIRSLNGADRSQGE